MVILVEVKVQWKVDCKELAERKTGPGLSTVDNIAVLSGSGVSRIPSSINVKSDDENCSSKVGRTGRKTLLLALA